MTDLARLEIRIVTDRARRDIDDLRRGLDETDEAGRRTSRTAEGLERSFRSMGSAIAAVAGAAALGQFLRSVTETAINIERLERQLTFATGSLQQARGEIEFAKRAADAFGTSAAASAEGLAKIQIAAQGTNVSLKDARELFVGVSAAASQLGLDAETTGGILLAFSQTISKGKIQTEELLQVAERGVPIFGILQRALGKNGEEIAELLQKGALLSDKVLPAIAAEMQKTFSADTGKRVESTQASIERLNNAVALFMTVIAQTGIVERFAQSIEAASVIILKFSRFVEDAINRVKQFFVGVGALNSRQLQSDIGETSNRIQALARSTEAAFQGIRDIDVGTTLEEMRVAFQKLGEEAGPRGQQFAAQFKVLDTELTTLRDRLNELPDDFPEIDTGRTNEELAKIDKQIKELLESMLKGGKGNDKFGESAKGAKDKLEKLDEEVKRFISDLQNLIDKLDPLAKAQSDYNADLVLLDKALATVDKTTGQKLLTDERHAELIERLAIAYRDALDPLGAFTRGLQEQAAIAGIVDENQQRIAQAVLAARQEFERYGPAAQEAAAQVAESIERQTIETERQVEVVRKAIDEFTVSSDEFADAWIGGLDEVGKFLSEGFVNGFKDAGDMIKNALKSLIAELIRIALINPILLRVGIAGLSAFGLIGPAQASQALSSAGGFGFPGIPGLDFFGGAGPLASQPGFPGSGLPGPGEGGGFFSSLAARSTFSSNPFLSGAGGFGGNLAGNLIFGGDRGAGANIGGSIGAIGGSFLLPGLPGVGTAIGGFVGNFLGGLFGGKPSNKSGTSVLDLSTGAIEIGGQTGKKFSQENRDAAQGLAESTLLFADSLERFGADLTGIIPQFEVGSKTGFSSRLNLGGERVLDQDFETAEQALNAMFDAIIDNAEKLPAFLEGLDLDKLDIGAEETIASIVDLGNAIETLKAVADPAETIGPFEQRLNELNAVFDTGAAAAKRLGLSTEELGQHLEAATAALRNDFVAGIEDAISAIQDPAAFQQAQAFEELEARFTLLRQEAEALGVPLDRINVLYELQKNSLQELIALGDVLAANAGQIQEFARIFEEATAQPADRSKVRDEILRGIRESGAEIGFTNEQIESFIDTLNSLSVGELPAFIDHIRDMGRQMGFSDAAINTLIFAIKAFGGTLVDVEDAAGSAGNSARDFAEGASEAAQRLKGLLSGLIEGDAFDILSAFAQQADPGNANQWVDAINSIRDFLSFDVRGVEDAAESITALAESQFDAVLQMIEGFDGSLEATQSLAEGLQDLGNTAVEVLQQIDDARSATRSGFDDLQQLILGGSGTNIIDTIKLQIGAFQSEAARVQNVLPTLSDPQEITRLLAGFDQQAADLVRNIQTGLQDTKIDRLTGINVSERQINELLRQAGFGSFSQFGQDLLDLRQSLQGTAEQRFDTTEAAVLAGKTELDRLIQSLADQMLDRFGLIPSEGDRDIGGIISNIVSQFAESFKEGDLIGAGLEDAGQEIAFKIERVFEGVNADQKEASANQKEAARIQLEAAREALQAARTDQTITIRVLPNNQGVGFA